MSIWRYADRFSSVAPEFRVTLGEGQTPLVRSRRLGPSVGLNHLYFKLESCNPSGSYKDRFAACAISHMRAAGQTRCVATTSGNTGAALAAYCAAAEISCHIAVLETAPIGKLQQMMAYGARISRVRRFGIDPQVTVEVFETLQRLGQREDTALQVSAFAHSPLGMSGVRTIAFELVEQLPDGIDYVFTQAGGGGMTLAVADGFIDLHRQQRVGYLPSVACVQPEGNNTIAGPLRDGAAGGQAVQCTTQISGLQVASVIDGDETIAACRATGGSGYLVSDACVWQVQKRLAREEGIFCEPAGATAIAGAIQAASEGAIDRDAVVVALVTGSGFKDPATIERMNADRQCELIDAKDLEGFAD
ncbi:pyridoxal-phosphate dependent enzyme [Candidatus Laterigemmans baculatus]|uniref:pyridoxal-phosphate dependent enzyme n=1 Tax=Candidatus Laterigemmans baculatus TaxID=2770505 RepID=UPI0013DC210F|nr:pyridoxal-phosphate dependent enzyme [Candidatus Laterigemmans baculatus]